MQTVAAIGIALATAISAVGATQNGQQLVRVCWETQLKEKDYVILSFAEAKTSKVFAPIGVRLEWSEDRRRCRSDSWAIWLSVQKEAPLTSGTEWLGYALPYERTHIVVFYDRVAQARGIVSAADMLAYVFAHEIAHILEGINRHSAGGIMKGSWDNTDRRQMTYGGLTFAPVDITLIHNGLNLRAGNLAVADQAHPSEE